MNFPQAALVGAISQLPQSFIYIIAGLLGAIIGSFLNAVIHRVPLEQSIIFPNSRCPSCGGAIAFYDNVPVFSYLLLGARCRSCKTQISFRYPAVETLTALLFVAVTWHLGLSWRLPFDLVFVSALVALIFIDAEHMLLPNAITYPGIAFSVIARLLIPYLAGASAFDDLVGLNAGLFAQIPLWAASLGGACIGALVGGGSLWLMGWTWERLRGIEAMGLGDVKMMFMVGAYLGWRLTILTIFIGVLGGSIVGILLMLRRGEKNMQLMLPFGVFLGVGAIASLLFGSRIIEWYLGQVL